MSIFLTAAFSYLLGSIPFGLLLVRIFRGQDVRRTGSGNIGATNVARSSPAAGHADINTRCAERTGRGCPGSRLFPGHNLLAVVAALFAIVGHMFPVWLKFRGGKGVATGLGSFSILAPKSHTGDRGRICGHGPAVSPRFSGLDRGGRALPCFSRGCCTNMADILRCWSLMSAASALIVARHHQNIGRLLSGTEPRFTTWSRQIDEPDRDHRGRRMGHGPRHRSGTRAATHEVRLWAHEKEVRDSISSRRVNELFLPGQSIPECVLPTGSLKEALSEAEIVVSVMPSQHCRPLVPADAASPQTGHAVRQRDQGTGREQLFCE